MRVPPYCGVSFCPVTVGAAVRISVLPDWVVGVVVVVAVVEVVVGAVVVCVVVVGVVVAVVCVGDGSCPPHDAINIVSTTNVLVMNHQFFFIFFSLYVFALETSAWMMLSITLSLAEASSTLICYPFISLSQPSS